MTLFVTGGGSGIGQHLARLAVERGESVAVFDLSIPGEVADGLVESAGPDRVSLHQGVDVRDLDGMRSAGATAGDDRRTVPIHSQCMRPDQLDDYAELGLSPSFFTVHTFYWGEEHLANLGEERASFISPMASAVADGLRCSNHTDFSVTPMDPMRVMWSSITRRRPSMSVR